MESVRNDLTKNYVDKYLILTTKEGKQQLEWRDYSIGNSENSDIRAAGPFIQNVKEGNTVEVLLTYSQGKYWLINNPAKPLRDVYTRIFPETPEITLRPEDCIKLGSLELQVCRFNVGKAEEKGDRQNMEDRMVLIQDIGLNSRLEVSMFAVMDG